MADCVEKLDQTSDQATLRREQIESRVDCDENAGIKFGCWAASGIAFPLRVQLHPPKSFFNKIGQMLSPNIPFKQAFIDCAGTDIAMLRDDTVRTLFEQLGAQVSRRIGL